VEEGDPNVQKGDLVRVVYGGPDDTWSGSEGILEKQHYNHNWEIRITKANPKAGESSRVYQTWGEENLELIKATDDADNEFIERRIYWEEQLNG
jgi:hypothetical protein